MDAIQQNSRMGILDKIFGYLSPGQRLLGKLADFAGQSDSLAKRLERHGERCSIPRLKEEVARLALEQNNQARELNRILSENSTWAKMPEPPVHSGSNNWERLSSDLEQLVQLALSLSRLALQWEGVDAKISDRIRAVALNDERLVPRLREVVEKLDPQALD
jgi:hypothetical protein